MIRLHDILFETKGDAWESCRQWASHRQKYVSGTEQARVTIDKGRIFTLKYEGPGRGISLAHADGASGDTLHQLFNILICEINPWLSSNTMKPDLDSIATRCIYDTKKKTYKLVIIVPCRENKRAWKLNHRGGWGHDPGMRAVINASPNSPQLETKTEYTTIPHDKHDTITTHFATWPI